MTTKDLICFKCKHFTFFQEGCAAFSEIPEIILETNEHNKVYPEQIAPLVFEEGEPKYPNDEQGIEGKMQKISYNDYPQSVSNNAKRGIELNKKVNNRCATDVGKIRAQQLANREKLSVKTIKRMYSYLSRAAEYYKPGDNEACGTISYLLWGGKAGLRWSRSKLKELGEID